MGEVDKYLFELYEKVPVGVFIVAADGRPILANETFRRLVGAGDVESWLAHLAPAEQQATREAWAACLSRGEPIRRDVPARTPDGKDVWLRWRALRLADGSVAGSLSDVTEIQAAREEAARASSAKTEFLANMSHEIRTPLNSVIGVADLLWESDLDAIQRKYVGVLREAGDHLLGLISDLLDLSRIEAGELALERHEFNLREQMDRAIDLVAARARAKRLDVHCRVAPDVPHFVAGDPLRLRQVLVNLMINAVKFTERGEVVLSVDQVGDGRVRFAVRDTGPGVAAEDQARIFLPFERGVGATRQGGVGLGLSISRRLVERMGGKLWVNSEPGRGSTFGFELALPVVESAVARPSLATVNLRGLKVLVADDNATGRLILHEMLVGWGAAPEMVEDPAGLLERVDQVDVLVLAANLDDGGEALVRGVRARRRPSELAVILIVSELRSRDHERQHELGIQAVLVKPVRRRELLDALRGAVSDVDYVALRRQRAPAPVTAPLRILLADDSEDNRLLFRAFLADTGHTLEMVADGRSAVDKAEHEPWDVILMDVQMPILDGLSAMREIRRFEREKGRPPVTILALTAEVMPEQIKRALDAGADGHVGKPLRRADLLQAIAGVSARAPRPSTERVHVEVTPTVAALVPGFLANREKDLLAARAALKRRDYHGLWVLAHTMKGLGASYGFDGITDIGAALEKAALAHDDAGVLRAVEALESYLGRVEYAVAS
jgi:signal transduction histidine kinase/DNA-binding response OmpR family regulator